jgi:uncharacterized protein YndB with AHSA1/START domain
MTELRSRAHAGADREAVWAILVDHARMSEWTSRVWRSRLVAPGPDDRNGVGAIRTVVTVAGPVREVVTAFEPPEHLEYRWVSDSALVRGYHASVDLTPGPHGGTEIDWNISFQPRLRLATALIVRLARFSTERFASDLARAADLPRHRTVA